MVVGWPTKTLNPGRNTTNTPLLLSSDEAHKLKKRKLSWPKVRKKIVCHENLNQKTNEPNKKFTRNINNLFLFIRENL